MESELAVEYSDAAVTIANILTSFEQAIRMLVLEENPLSSLDFVRMNLSRFVSRGDLIERGGYSDVYRGVLTSLKKKKPNWSWLRPLSWCRRVQPIEVAIKQLRFVSRKDHSFKRILLNLFREARIWSELHHLNVVEFLGFTVEESGWVSLISPWYSNGDLRQYLQANPTASRGDLILDVAEGVKYLHGLRPAPLAHGDLKAANVLVNALGVACLSDFGLSGFVAESCRATGFTTDSNGHFRGSLAWTSQELVLHEHSKRTTKSDIYAFAGVWLEILSLKEPFYYVSSSTQLIIDLCKGSSIDRKQYEEIDFNHPVWNILESCWCHDAEQRPTIRELTRKIYTAYGLRPRKSGALFSSRGIRSNFYAKNTGLYQRNAISLDLTIRLDEGQEAEAPETPELNRAETKLSPNGYWVCTWYCRFSDIRIVFHDLESRKVTGCFALSTIGSDFYVCGPVWSPASKVIVFVTALNIYVCGVGTQPFSFRHRLKLDLNSKVSFASLQHVVVSTTHRGMHSANIYGPDPRFHQVDATSWMTSTNEMSRNLRTMVSMSQQEIHRWSWTVDDQNHICIRPEATLYPEHLVLSGFSLRLTCDWGVYSYDAYMHVFNAFVWKNGDPKTHAIDMASKEVVSCELKDAGGGGWIAMLIQTMREGWYLVVWHKDQMLSDVVTLKLDHCPTLGRNSRLWDFVVNEGVGTLTLTRPGELPNLVSLYFYRISLPHPGDPIF